MEKDSLLIKLQELLAGEHGELLSFLQCEIVPNESMKQLPSCSVLLNIIEAPDKNADVGNGFCVSLTGEYHHQIFGCDLYFYLDSNPRVVIDIHKNGHTYLGANRVRYYLVASYDENQFSWKVPTGYCTMNITLKLPV